MTNGLAAAIWSLAAAGAMPPKPSGRPAMYLSSTAKSALSTTGAAPALRSTGLPVATGSLAAIQALKPLLTLLTLV